jgi:regulator of replication initiation timing
VQAMIKYSQNKDQFLKVAIKRMHETQTFKDELKAMIELNSILLARNEELKTKLVNEIQLKVGNFPLSFILASYPSNTLD